MNAQQAITTHYQNLHSRALRLTKNEADAADLVQTVALRAMERADQFDPSRAEPKRWLFGIMRNVFLSEARRGKVYREKVVPAVSENLRDAEMLSATGIETGAYRSKVAQALAELSSEERDAVLMHSVEGFKYREIAEALNVPLGTARSWINRGRKKMAASIVA